MRCRPAQAGTEMPGDGACTVHPQATGNRGAIDPLCDAPRPGESP
jgi:hypothetical protein